MHLIKFDASIICFTLVIMAAIPVATLRTHTYSIGYELGKLKKQEKDLRQKNAELKSSLATTERQIRDKYTRNTKGSVSEFYLPDNRRILSNIGEQ